MLPPHPSGFNKHIGKCHHPPYRFTSVYPQNGNQIVIVLVLQCFSLNRKPSESIHKSQENQKGQTLKEDKPRQAIRSVRLTALREETSINDILPRQDVATSELVCNSI